MKFTIEPPTPLSNNNDIDIRTMFDYQLKLYNELQNILNSGIDTENLTDSLKKKIEK